MKNFKITNTNGIKLKTSNKYIDDDINVSVDSTNLVSENIKEGIKILGVTGTMQSSSGSSTETTLKTLLDATQSAYYLFYKYYYEKYANW